MYTNWVKSFFGNYDEMFCHSRPLFLYFCLFYKQLKNIGSIKVADDWIRTADLWWRKQPLCTAEPQPPPLWRNVCRIIISYKLVIYDLIDLQNLTKLGLLVEGLLMSYLRHMLRIHYKMTSWWTYLIDTKT